MKEVDRVLSEAGAMLAHWSLYLRFVASSAQVSSHPAFSVEVRMLTIKQTDELMAINSAENKPLVAPDFINDSPLPKKIIKTLIDPFTTFATYFLRRSIERAFQLDEAPEGLHLSPTRPLAANPPYITSAVDDVMYVVNQILQRAMATSQADIVVTVATTIGRVLGGSDFIEMIRKKMRDESYPKASVQGALPPDDKVLAFLVLMNNLDVATDYVKRIVRTHHDEEAITNGTQHGAAPRSLTELFPLNRDATNVRNALRNLEAGFSAKANELVNDGLSVTFQQVLKPRLRPMLTEAFRDTDYFLSVEEQAEQNRTAEYEQSEDGDSVRARLAPAWEILIRPMKRILTERLSDRLTSTAIAHLANLLERRIWSYYGRVSEVGAVALERDIAGVMNVASKGESFRSRQAFNRCSQITTIMNLEDDEWDALRHADDVDSEWILDDKERVRARTIVRGRD